MSVHSSAAIWQYSRMTKSARLVMLSLADRADDDGYCWPSLADIARRCLIDYRTAQYCVRLAEKAAELFVRERSGRTSQFLVLPGMSTEAIYAAFLKRFKMGPGAVNEWIITRTDPGKVFRGGNFSDPTRFSWGSGKIFQGPLKSDSDEPSINTNKPSLSKKDDPTRWSGVLEQLKNILERTTFERYIAPLHSPELNNGNLQIIAPSRQIADWCQGRMTSTVSRLLTGIHGHEIGVIFEHRSKDQ
ncbi:MAG: hypothetical protein DWQ07_15475 [Chloroflexi bacterium]|nr:MAG: hypothetical protein DWQ07_15475 [Chloroflexota bacterium]MBL1197265.1 hypothetical protein [Chloroflexota bacterium]NOH14559.1 hypothetical protein [Chloroflexota bacterium]